MNAQYLKILIFLILGVVFTAGGILTNFIIQPKNPTKEKQMTYECGEDPIGGAWVKFNVRFFVIALIFVLFDVEIVFLFPWALVLKDMGVYAFGEMGVFILILLVGFAYVWVKGDLNWQRPAPVVPKLEDLVSMQKPVLHPAPAPATAPQTEPVAEPAVA